MQRIAIKAHVFVSTRIREISEMDRERGLTTTEIAVLTFVLVTAAVVVGTILFQYAQDQANALPDNPTENITDPAVDTGGG